MSEDKRRAVKRPGSIKDQLADLNAVGKMPPQAIALEEAVLGAIMIESGAMIHVIDFLKPECFYMENHGIIYRACKRLFNKNDAVF